MIQWPPADADADDAIAGPAAMLSLGAAAVHFAVIGEHLHEFVLYGILFVLVSWFQAWWAVQYVARPTARLERVAVLVNAGVAAIWVWSRTIGLPVAPPPGGPEVVGTADVITTAFEIGLVVLLIEAIRLRSLARPDATARISGGVRLTLQVVALAAVVAGTTVALSTLASSMTMG